MLLAPCLFALANLVVGLLALGTVVKLARGQLLPGAAGSGFAGFRDSRGAVVSAAKTGGTSASSDTRTRYRKRDVDGVSIFYREAGSNEAPTILLLHGFPSSSHMFRRSDPRACRGLSLDSAGLSGVRQ